jgi:tetratricopeptide (TPR) repeat protein/tRNA A-37 threonylcarbamoyl transferase component Bud32
MTCPACGGDIPVSSHRCPQCRASLSHGLAAAVLTPPPFDGATRVGRVTPENDTTGLPALDSSFDAPTLVGARTGTGVPDDFTTLVPTSNGEGTQAVTRLGPEVPGGLSSESGRALQDEAEDTGPLKPGKPFGTRYHIIRMLGLGGMGAVYQAWDEELGVAVAIKVIRPEVMADPEAAQEIERRFKRELLLAREVTHKNVVRIHDLGEIGGIKYITMSYIDGTDLATIIKREGRLSVPKALLILRSVIPGLVAAHAAGVVHRDLKPANIMVGKKGDALIMDFGIAMSVAKPDIAADDEALRPERFRAAAGIGEGATQVGSVLGTIHYMAPEQSKGQAVDQRADIYAMGLILYDMLLGRRRAEKADSVLGELEARIAHAPQSVRSIAPEVPSALDAIVSRCLDPDPAKRFQTTVDMVAALDKLDDNGEPLPVRRVVGLPLMAAVVVVMLSLGVGAWYYQRQFIPPEAHDPVSVVIADFRNSTGDAAFDRTLEPMLKLALEGAGFISAYSRVEVARNLGVRPPELLDETAAREIAVKQGLGVVLSGEIVRRGNGYSLSAKAVQAVTGELIASAEARAAGRDQVLSVATGLANEVREALGDDTSDSAQRFAIETLSATSLDVVRAYATAMGDLSDNRPEDARRRFQEAVDRDPNFGLAYAGMAIASRNIGQQQDAERYIREAVRHVDGMTERERYRTRGLFYYVTSDYPQCVKEYGDLIARYSADAAAHNNLALCLTYMRQMPRALEEMREVVGILPRRALYRLNLALYAAYSSDFQTAEQEAAAAQELESPLGFLADAFAQLGQGRVSQAAASYERGKTGTLYASYASSGLGDLAVYEGRYSEAIRILQAGANADVMSGNTDRAAAKFAAVAQAQLLRQNRGAAIAAAVRALDSSTAVKIRFLAARVFVEAGDTDRARTLATGLASEFQGEPQAYAKIIEGELALKAGDPRLAITTLNEATALLDTWIGRFDLGRAYLEAGAFTQADSEFDRCLARRGEALALFLDEEPTYGIFPAVYYYQGRAREGLNTAGFANSYRAYLDIRGTSTDDPLLADIRRRAAGRP